MLAYVKFQMPKELVDKVYEALEVSSKTGKVKMGVNEATKSIERGQSQLVVMAEDVEPEELLMHLPVLCDEKQVAFAYVPSKVELGKASGIPVPTSTVSITEVGDAKRLVESIVQKIKGLKG